MSTEKPIAATVHDRVVPLHHSPDVSLLQLLVNPGERKLELTEYQEIYSHWEQNNSTSSDCIVK